jgi:hypothetical protein
LFSFDPFYILQVLRLTSVRHAFEQFYVACCVLCVVCCVLKNTHFHLKYPSSRFRVFFISIPYALCIFSDFPIPHSTFRIPISAFPLPHSPFPLPHSPFSPSAFPILTFPPSQPPTFSLFRLPHSPFSSSHLPNLPPSVFSAFPPI